MTNSPAWRLSLEQMREVREGGAGESEGRDSPLTLPLLENLELRPSSAWPHYPVSFLPQIQCQALPLTSPIELLIP